MAIYQEPLEVAPEHRHIVTGGFRTLRGHVIRTVCRQEMLTLTTLTDWENGVQFIGGPEPCTLCQEFLETQLIILECEGESEAARISFRLTPQLAQSIDQVADECGVSRSNVVRQALDAFFARNDLLVGHGPKGP